MSATIDERVVEMRFDNRQFESNAKQSISTIDKLKKALNFSDTSNTFNNLQRAADGVNLNGLEKSVDSVKVKFSALQVAAATVLSNIVNKAVDAGTRFAKALSVDSMSSGFHEYELKMGSIQTILANTQSRNAEVSKEALESVNVTATRAVEKSEELNNQLLQSAQAAHAQQLEAFNDAAQAELKAFEKGSRAQLKAFDKQVREEQKAQSKAAQKEIEAFDKKTQKKLKKLQEQQADEIEVLQESYETKLEAFQEEQEAEMDTLQENHKAKLKLYKEEYMQQLKAADEDRYKKIKEIDDQIDAINGLTKAENEEREAAERAEKIEELERAVQIAKNSAARRKAEKELADYKDQIAREDLLKQRKQQIEELEAQKDVVNDEFQEKKDALQEEYEARVEAQNKVYEEEYKALQKQQKLRREQIQESYQEELEGIRKQQEKKVEALQEQRKNERENLTERIEDEQEALSDQISDRREALNDQLEAEKEAITDRQEEERKALEARQRDELQAIAERHQAELQGIEEEKNARISALQASAGRTKGSTLEDVNKALDELNEYSDKTIYNFAEMTRNIGTFTAAGVDLDTSVKAIKGIANLAALSGSSSQQASTAMYQLSQAIAAGKVNLQDWNSVVNAGMGGKTFQDSLIETARVHGIAVDDMIAKNGSFRESIREGWITSDILLETLSKFTGDLSEAQLKSMGYTDEQVKGIQNMAKTAVASAQDVKTFSQLLSTLSEEAGSGWSQTFEIIFGNFEEAKKLWTDIYKVLGGLIGGQADARNELLKGWKDLGGRKVVIEGLTNAWKALVSIMKPIKEAFRDVFPPTTAEQLMHLSEGFRDFTERLKISDETSDKLKRTFSGLFSILDIVKQVIVALVPGVGIFGDLAGGILSVTAALGDWITGLAKTTEKHQVFEKTATKIREAVDKIFEGFKNLFDSSVLSSIGNGFHSVTKSMSKAAPIFDSAFGLFGDALSKFGSVLKTIFSGGSIDKALNILQGGILASIGINISKLVKNFSDVFVNSTGFISSLSQIKDSVVDTFSAIQSQLKSGVLLKIAASIGILAVALVVIASIDTKKLDTSLGAIAVLFGELLGVMLAFDKVMSGSGLRSISRISKAMLTMSASVLILASAMKKIAEIEPDRLTGALEAASILLGELTAVAIALSKYGGKINTGALSMIAFAAAILILTQAVKQLSGISFDQLMQGLLGVGLLMTELALTMNLLGEADHVISSAASLLLLAGALNLLVIPVKAFGEMKPSELGKGLLAIGIALGEIAIGMNLLPKNMISLGTGMIAVGAALVIISSAVEKMGDLSWEQIAKGLTAIGIALLELAAGLKLMSGSLSGSAALLVASVAILALAPALKLLGSMSIEQIVSALVALAGAFVIIGAAGVVLGPLAPQILALSAAVALLGVGVLAAGAGLMAFAAAMTAMAGTGVIAATTFVMSLRILFVGLLNTIRDSAGALAEAAIAVIKALCDVIAKCAPEVAEALLTLIDEGLKSLAKHIPSIVGSIADLITGILNTLADKMPEFVKAVVNLFVEFFSSLVEAVKGIATDKLEEALIGVGILAGLMTAFAGLSTLSVAATAGVVAFGKFIGELAIVIAAAGAIYKIPGVDWLLSSGGEFLYKIGDAIGKFIGGVVGGLLNGITKNLPEIAKNLSGFMINLTPFLAGTKMIDDQTTRSVAALADMILTLTQAAVINGLASWFTGENNLEKFGNQLAAFGPKFSEYANAVSGIKGDSIESSTNAAKSLAALASNLPDQGGLVSWFSGDNQMSVFGKELVSFGKSFAQYAKDTAEIKPSVVTTSTNCAEALVELANNIPKTGGLFSIFTGDESMEAFGKGLKAFGASLVGYYEQISQITNFNIFNKVIEEVKKLINIAKDIEGIDTSGMARFGKDLEKMGKKGINEFLDAFKNSNAQVQKAVKSLTTYLFGQLKAKLPDSSFISIGQKATKALAQGLNNYASLNKVGKASKDVSDAAYNNIKNNLSYDTFYGIGENVAYGLANGITSKINDIANAAINAAYAAINAAQSTLVIYSPSRVFTKMGQYVSIGLANGIIDKIPVVTDAGTTMADRVINPVQAVFDHITDVIESDALDVNPCIVPTIDLSQVVDGANQISSMFGGFNLTPTAALAQGAYASFGATARDIEAANANKLLTDKLDKLIDATSEESRIENHNVFNINSTDPREAAEEVGYVLQRQYERGRAAWGR